MQPGGKLAENIMHFARVLRAAGLPTGPGKTIDAIRAVDACGIRNREDFYWALHAVFVNRQDQRVLFDQAFHIFWRNPKILERMMSLLLPTVRPEDMGEDQEQMLRRLAEALMPGRGESAGAEAEEEVRIDAVLTYSDRELLQQMDFEAMSNEELARAKAAIARLRLPIQQVKTRRFRPVPQAPRVDMRATLRAGLRSGGAIIPLKRRAPKLRHPPLVVLCDISGSMARYSRMFLHFMHAITNDRDRVYSFLFGTRLTNITRQLRHRDVDLALGKVAEQVEDWSGGTRIGQCLHQFNQRWGRRVLSQGAVVLFVSDGLDRDAAEGLDVEIERLHKSCRRLVWLNPLLRWEGFEPKSKGIQAILPHVDEFRPVHNLDSLEQLTAVLSRPAPRRADGLGPWHAWKGAAA
jgi:uncharacterized protein with von Willebrand factor type A (vWA) domain